MNLLDVHPGAATMRTGSFLTLLREYKKQARDNFAKEAVLFAIITAIGLVWPIAYTLTAVSR